MALKVELKPHEKIIVGSCVITNTDQRAKFLIEGERLPVLREKDILTPDTADTPAKLMHLDHRLGSLEKGKDADFVVLSGDPFSVHTRVLQTFVEGKKVFDLDDPKDRVTYFDVGRGWFDEKDLPRVYHVHVLMRVRQLIGRPCRAMR